MAEYEERGRDGSGGGRERSRSRDRNDGGSGAGVVGGYAPQSSGGGEIESSKLFVGNLSYEVGNKNCVNVCVCACA